MEERGQHLGTPSFSLLAKHQSMTPQHAATLFFSFADFTILRILRKLANENAPSRIASERMSYVSRSLDLHLEIMEMTVAANDRRRRWCCPGLFAG